MYALIVFLPLIGFMIAGVIALSQAHKAAPHAPEDHGHHGPGTGDKIAQYVTIAGMLASLGLSVIAFAGVVGGSSGPVTVELIPWITSGDFIASWALRFDTLTVVMLIVVTGVSTMVHIYSVGYMSHDPHSAFGIRNRVRVPPRSRLSWSTGSVISGLSSVFSPFM